MKKKTIASLAALGAVLGAATAAGLIISNKRKQQLLAQKESQPLLPKKNIYIAGGGLAGLSCAFYLIHDCKIPGECIHIFEDSSNLGGKYNIGGNVADGYICTTPTLFSSKDKTMLNLLKNIKSCRFDDMTVFEEITDYSNTFPVYENKRLAGKKGKTQTRLKISILSLNKIKALICERDENLSDISIEKYFSHCKEFLKSNLWEIISSSYYLKKSSSVLELKYVLKNSASYFLELFNMKTTIRSQYNMQETVIDPLADYLKKHNAQILCGCTVNDVDFAENENKITALHLNDNGTKKTLYLNSNDLCFITNGAVSECASLGDAAYAADKSEENAASISLWKNISLKCNNTGNPDSFINTNEGKIVSFTITTDSSLLFDSIEKFTSNTDNSGVMTTFKESPWGLTLVTVPQPYFTSQTDKIYVICGYALNTEANGKYINKTIEQANGSEIFYEIISLLGLKDIYEELADDTINVIPCVLPYAVSSSIPHSYSDKPLSVSSNYKNFAFIGQFTRTPEGGITHSSEYVVRTSKNAAYQLTKTSKQK